MGDLLDFTHHQRFGRPVVTVLLATDPGFSVHTYPLDNGEEKPVAFGFAHDLEHAETIFEAHTGQTVDIRWHAGRSEWAF
jgi:hypothetical protein